MATVELKEEPPVKYIDLTVDKVSRIFKEHVMEGNIVKEFALAIGSERVS
jgi:(2Fe-2S) ferredoxin